MKMRILVLIMLYFTVVSCNKSRDFPDYEYQTVYFAYQYPVRTLTMGEDVFDTQLDNQHKCKIMATTGGVYYAKKDVTVGIAVDNSLLGNGLLFGAGKSEVLAMPSHYYTLADNKIIIPAGGLAGGVEVQLTDAFFADPKAISNNYVIPLRIGGVAGADSILAGKDFILYAVKYVNTWHGNYLRRGKDVVTGSVNQTITRHQLYVEDDAVNKLTTRSLTTAEFPVVIKDKNGTNVTCVLLLTFDEGGNCIITAGSSNFTVTGSGKFVKKGEQKSWGNQDRDALYLNYNMTLADMQLVTTDTLVLRDRAVTMETFTPIAK
ncbi:DUF5627 domain-containing protein [Chitinophaga sp. sic0106]|uniref:DUF5627 domain-containing protein n=1 Tax=Chitinophaga sp. sic0106 TaxID=2854785 RepID=UPI001C47D8F3|nr:DUF5627 domain-containing protein [Chitinophaga sp. sic0106]MBV7530899.1 DUF1735 domain-containing protein [Chitinophaga sp. sic0106]